MPAARQITDRAHRYRANKLLPVKGKRCLFCSSKQNLVPDHWDGNPTHTNAANLEVLCKSCNTAKGAAFKKAGRGRLTHQYNPTKGGGAANIGEWMQAVGAIIPREYPSRNYGLRAGSTMSTQAAVDMIRATPQSKRKDFASRLRRRNPTWDGRPMTQAQRDAAYAQEERDEAEAAKHAEWVREQFKKKRLRGNPASDQAAGRATADMSTAERARALKTHIREVEEDARRPLMKSELQILKNRFRAGAKAAKRNPVEVTSTDKQQAEFAAKDLRRKGHVAVKVIKRTRGEAWQSHGAHKPVYVVTSRGQLSRNPAAASAEVYKEFHGHGPREVVTVVKRVHVHEHLAAAGALRRLVVLGIDKRKHTIRDFGGAILAFNENKNQLFVEGGDQSLNLEDYGIDSPHELETLGKVQKIDYKADKSHLGAEGGRATYTHQFRTTNENGRHVVVSVSRYPDLVYDVPNQQLLFSGGSYTIRAEGIDV